MKKSAPRDTFLFWVLGIFFLFIAVIIGGAFALFYFKGPGVVTTRDIQSAEKIAGLRFTSKERRMMLGRVRRNLSSYEELRKVDLPNPIAPSLLFSPMVPGLDANTSLPSFMDTGDTEVRLPVNLQDLAFYPVTALAGLIKSRQATSLELTRLYLDRLKKYGPQLNCMITLTEDKALDQARRAEHFPASPSHPRRRVHPGQPGTQRPDAEDGRGDDGNRRLCRPLLRRG